eukprot:5937401-Pleurochrysis_carterae.AAC.2
MSVRIKHTMSDQGRGVRSQSFTLKAPSKPVRESMHSDTTARPRRDRIEIATRARRDMRGG